MVFFQDNGESTLCLILGVRASITHEEFDTVRKWAKNRKTNGHAWKVSIKEIQERNYNLDFKNPNNNSKAAHKDPKEVLESIAGAEKEIAEILEEIKNEI